MTTRILTRSVQMKEHKLKSASELKHLEKKHDDHTLMSKQEESSIFQDQEITEFKAISECIVQVTYRVGARANSLKTVKKEVCSNNYQIN